MPAATASALAAPSSSTGITARKNGKSLARNMAKPLAGVLLEQPLRLAPSPAVARKALAHRPIFKTPRRGRHHVDQLDFEFSYAGPNPVPLGQ